MWYRDVWRKGTLLGSGSFGDIYQCYNGKYIVSFLAYNYFNRGDFCAVKEIRYEEFDQSIYEV